MRFIDLTEGVINKATEEDISPEVIADVINKNCDMFLSASHRRSLYRGVNTGGEGLNFDHIFLEISPHPDRLPTDTNYDMHTIAVELMIEEGLKAHRGNSFFCTGDYNVASNFGTIYRMFPKSFSFSWSNEVYDFYNYAHTIAKKVDQSEWPDELRKIIKTYKTDGLVDAIDSGGEIILTCSSAYFVDDSFFDEHLNISKLDNVEAM